MSAFSSSGPTREQIVAYLDGELSAAEASEVLAWLEAHPDALKAVEEQRRVWSLLGAYRDEPVPEGFASRVLSRTSASAAGGGAPASGHRPFEVVRGGRARALAIAAGVVLAVGVGGFAARRFFPPRASDEPRTVARAVEAVPASLLESENLVDLASYSDEDFEALLSADLDSDSPARGK